MFQPQHCCAWAQSHSCFVSAIPASTGDCSARASDLATAGERVGIAFTEAQAPVIIWLSHHHSPQEPTIVVDKYGADALRLYLINSPVVRAESLRFEEAGVFSIVKDVFLPWCAALKCPATNPEASHHWRPVGAAVALCACRPRSAADCLHSH